MASAKQKKFLENLYRSGREAGLTHVQAQLASSQAALETGYGKHVKGNNYFGIKASKSWEGKTQNFRTHEYINGKKTYINDKFRVYETPADSMKDWFSTVKKQWPKAATAKTLKEAATALVENKGKQYATDPAYINKILGVNSNNSIKDNSSHYPDHYKNLPPEGEQQDGDLMRAATANSIEQGNYDVGEVPTPVKRPDNFPKNLLAKNNEPTNLLGVFDKPNTRTVKHVGGKNRPHPPADEVMTELQNTAEKHIPKGYTVKITSGTGEYKTRRHRKSNGIFETGGSAADVQIFDKKGKPASQAIRKNFAKGWAGETRGGVGMGHAYMGKNSVHVDLITPERKNSGEGMQWGHGHNNAKSLGLDAIRNSKHKYLPTYPDAPTPRPNNAPKSVQDNYYDQVPNARMGETVNPINETAKSQLKENPVRSHTLDPSQDLGGRSGYEQRGIPIPKKRPNRFNAPIPNPRPSLETIYSSGEKSGVSNGIGNTSVERRGPISPVNKKATIFPSGSNSGSDVAAPSGKVKQKRLLDIQNIPIHAQIIDDFDAKAQKARSKNIGGYDEVPMIVSDPIKAMQETSKNPYMPIEPMKKKGLLSMGAPAAASAVGKGGVFDVPIPTARPNYQNPNALAITPSVNEGPYEVGKEYENKNLPMSAEGRWSMGANEDGKKQTYLGPNNPNDRMNPLKYIFSNLFPSGSGNRKFSAGGVAGALLGGAVGGPVGALLGNKIGGKIFSGGSNTSSGGNSGGSNFSGAPSMRNVYDSGSDNSGNSWQVASNGAMGRNVRSNTNKYGVTTYTDEDTGNQLGTSGGKSLFSGLFG